MSRHSVRKPYMLNTKTNIYKENMTVLRWLLQDYITPSTGGSQGLSSLTYLPRTVTEGSESCHF